MSKYFSRHTAYSQKSVPHQKRTIALYGEGEYRGVWFRCWNCGFINHKDRARTEDTFQGGDGSMADEFGVPPSPYGMADASVFLTIDALHSMDLMKVDANGVVMALNTPRYVKITGGCAFCGSMNYR